MRDSIKKSVIEKIFMASDQHKTDDKTRNKKRSLRELELSLSTMYPNNDLFHLLSEKLDKEAKQNASIISLGDLKTRINSVECERLTLSMKGLKQKGIEAVYSAKDRKLSFLKDGVFFQTFRFISPTLAKQM